MRLLPVGDTAFSVEFGDSISDSANARVMALAASIDAGGLEGVVELVPSFRSLLVVLDPQRTSFANLAAKVGDLARGLAEGLVTTGRHWTIPVHYDGPDLEEVACACDLSTAEVIALHTGTVFRVHMLGFLPGFAYMAELPPPLRLPRRAEPRVRVPAGSVAIADAMTAIYPWESPGGWHLIGRTGQVLFDPSMDPPALLAPGDSVSFEVA